MLRSGRADWCGADPGEGGEFLLRVNVAAVAAVRRARAADWPRIRQLLAAESLPTSDLSANSIANFTVAIDAGEVVGAIAIECHGAHGLLRSLVVDPAHRGSRLAHALVQAAEDMARSEALASLVLLTQTAAAFFQSLGYREIARDAVPETVRSSAEFTHLCPGDSTCMTKTMDPKTL
jgi:N-acetylglutamate synthase-like GNAT family acetyltransferase